MNNFDYLSQLPQQQQFSSGYAPTPDTSTMHGPEGTQGGGILNSFCGLGGKGKTAPGSAVSPSAGAGSAGAMKPMSQISVPYRSNNPMDSGAGGGFAGMA